MSSDHQRQRTLRVIEEIRARNVHRLKQRAHNAKYSHTGVQLHRPRFKPSPIQDVQTLLEIIDAERINQSTDHEDHQQPKQKGKKAGR